MGLPELVVLAGTLNIRPIPDATSPPLPPEEGPMGALCSRVRRFPGGGAGAEEEEEGVALGMAGTGKVNGVVVVAARPPCGLATPC